MISMLFDKYYDRNIKHKQQQPPRFTSIPIEIDLLFDADYAEYIAAAPVHQNSSFGGSGLPFMSEDIAFCNTPNVGWLHKGDKLVLD